MTDDLFGDDPELDPAETRLIEAFLATEEAEAWQEFGDAASEALEQGKGATVEVPVAFLRLVLPQIRSSPHIFDAMNQAWNRVCDELGMPERKKPAPEQDLAEEEAPGGSGLN